MRNPHPVSADHASPNDLEGPDPQRTGPLHGVRIVEFAGIGPAPFGCMLLADMGAEIIRIDRPGAPSADPRNLLARGRIAICLDLKHPAAVGQVLELLAHADALVEAFRPGVMERLGLGPDVVAQHNQRLVYARMTGWGQDGPLAQAAGHDINYIAVAGALAAIGPANERPSIPLNLIGDFGGGGTYLAMGVLAALLEARKSGRGQVVDAAICDGVVSLMTSNAAQTLRGRYREQRGSNMLDGAAPYYAVYETADGLYVSVGAIEPKFFAALCDRVGIPESLRDAQNDRTRWPQLHAKFAQRFRTRSRADWCAALEGTDACFAPVLHLGESTRHAHLVARQCFVQVDGLRQPAPAPRFSRTPSSIRPARAADPASIAAHIDRWRQLAT
ncbi:CaiB/BaiF CoA-transferase family protein [Comamonadaceae bacterium G21597-S1]|nr:CaiB/BaiF CoA-transferase family protein [Comamonadaceae bacterium G21597-S1]